MNMPAISTVGGHVLENRSLAVQRYDGMCRRYYAERLIGIFCAQGGNGHFAQRH